MRLKKWVYITPVVLALIAGGGYFGYTKYQAYLAEQARLEEEKKRETLYVSSDEKTVKIDRRDGEGSLTLVRGTPVETRVLPLVVKENEEDENEVGKEYRLVYINEEEYLMTDDELCWDVKDAVKEKSGFVTLPCVLYKEASGPAIAGMASKSAEAQIIGYGNLLPDGSVDRYQVDLNGQQGYLRPEYLVRTAEEVKDTVADFQYEREDLYGGGNAYTLEYPDLPKPDFADNHMPRECRTLYLNKACIEYIDDYIEIANNSGVNAFIIDMKESDGPAYESEVIKEFSPTSYQYAWNTFDDYKAAVQKCKDAGIYVIGRIVTFKDDLFAQDHPEMCLVDTATGSPFLLASAYWPSPYQRTVWEYNIRLAIEGAEKIGFNEINFDYIRFPDMIDLVIDGIDFRNDYGETMAQAINRFMLYARDELHERGVYMSADVFGETSNDYVCAYGQYWPMMSNIADVMCAMPYPDHFAIHDYGIEQAVWEVPYQLLYYWGSYVTQRQAETPNPAKVRTWIQGFDTTWKEPQVEYTVDKINEQIEGLYANGLDDGYMVWNAPSELYRYWAYTPAFYERVSE
ncbi:MAG: putative glycoside hydrolase [Erysipelotrichaceae bacterium]|nr:putative glycoside hydrolase [Erysipelotrichaceae bacterium]